MTANSLMIRFRFRALHPNTDIVLEHSGEGYFGIDETQAWKQLSNLLNPGVHDLSKSVETLKTRYTIERF